MDQDQGKLIVEVPGCDVLAGNLTLGGTFEPTPYRDGLGLPRDRKNTFTKNGKSVHLEENYNAVSTILEKINYQKHRWMVYGDFKMLTMFLGQQAGYKKYPCFLCCGTVESETSIRPKLTGHLEVP
ncbi:hypothetical protein AVEN_150591-1 [Araneus ventricosus]|uniref:Uncharacterized protein n=1 Tax=Araneus ventricosus TaxID=182803 RepID=A0A4Y2M833_ARAVE|nr:hypothetical protein AVEN_150591-1 [Araneus ventricosus]